MESQIQAAPIHPPAYPMTSPRQQNPITVSNSCPAVVIHIGKESSASATAELVLQMTSLPKISQTFPETRTFMYPFLATLTKDWVYSFQVVTWMFLWTSITNPYVIHISPVGEWATMLGQSKNCSSLWQIKPSLK